MFKIREHSIANDVFWYIDDGRPITVTAWEGWLEVRKVCCTLINYGLQDTGRKRTG